METKTLLSVTNPIPSRCPVCGGNGIVPNGFYNQTSGHWSSTSTEPEKCRSCNGTGIVWYNETTK